MRSPRSIASACGCVFGRLAKARCDVEKHEVDIQQLVVETQHLRDPVALRARSTFRVPGATFNISGSDSHSTQGDTHNCEVDIQKLDVDTRHMWDPFAPRARSTIVVSDPDFDMHGSDSHSARGPNSEAMN